MKKRIYVILICVCAFVTLCLNRLLASYSEQSPNSRDIALNKATVETNMVEYIYVSADLAVNYEDYRKLIADAELIVVGYVSDVNGELNKEGLICSKVTLENLVVLKGTEQQRITVLTPGGVISAKEFYAFHEELLRAKLTSKGYEDMVKSFTADDCVTCDFMGTKRFEIGKTYLLFLTFDESVSSYQITGSSYFGVYEADENQESFIRNINGKAIACVSSEELVIGVNTIPDNSEYLREKRKTVIPSTKEIIIDEKDPQYDKYKGDL